MEARLAVLGLAMVTLMGATFVATGGDRGGLYVAVNTLSVAAALAATVGAARFPARVGLALLAGGLLGQALLRGLNVLLDLTRLPVWDSALILVGWAVAGGAALAWAARPETPRPGGLRWGLYLAGVGYFLALMVTLASGRLASQAALLVGTLGLLMAAPAFEPLTASPGG